jgi:phosphatidate cytidylyltransferase
MTALVGLPILLLFIYLGGAAFAFMVTVLATIGLYEFARMTEGKQQFLFIPVLLGIWIMLLGSYRQWPHWTALGILITFCIVFMVAVFRFPAFDVDDIAINFLGLIYIGWTMAHLIAFDSLGNGRLLVLYLFVAIWSSDSGAYFVGRLLGKHKLCPRVSPKKTIEGSIGGIVTTCVLLSLLNLYVAMLPSVVVVIIAVVISIIGQVGDLIESLIKRYYGVKDSGKLLPGHGGVLDRFDSIMLAAPVMYYCIVIAQYIGA